ncbi:MAG: hypothetical protein ACREQ5_05925 [Candidatus Dormibacteria bacterium]
MKPSASPSETVLSVAALAALAVGILALAAGARSGVAVVDVALSYLAVAWALSRGLTR